jgi:cytochrome P450 PksS
VRFPIIGRTWITTTSELAGRVFKDNETFTMRKDDRVAGLRWWMPGWIRTLAVSMLTMDEPDHTRLRSIVDEAFRRRAILDMEPRIFAIADELAADLFTEATPADLVERYARRLPLFVICEIAGPACRGSAPLHRLGEQPHSPHRSPQPLASTLLASLPQATA